MHLKLPATSANLGPGFDAIALALSFYLTIDATPAPTFTIQATGRNAEQVSSLENNLLLNTYQDLAPSAPPLALTIHNEIPLGMGLGSLAAALLAGVLLANHFAPLHLTPQQILEEACIREGHPDNVAACFFGGLTVSAMQGREVTTATLPPTPWRLLLALPAASLATTQARALLPPTYTRADAVTNIQSTALLVAAFVQSRPELLLAATRDTLHQPFRLAACPLLPLLLPLAGAPDIHAVTLSGAGPSVLLITDARAPLAPLLTRIRSAASAPNLEILETGTAPVSPEGHSLSQHQ